MTVLFDADWRTSYPLSRILSIRDAGSDDQGTRSYHLVLKGDEGSAQISAFTYNRIASSPLELMPAQQGIEALSVWFDEGVAQVNKSPVIAWARCFDGSIRIVTPAGVDDGHLWTEGQGYILMPDGVVRATGEYLDFTEFESLDAYIAHEADEERQRAEARA